MRVVKKIPVLTSDRILEMISEYDIYRYYFGDFVINRKYLNHLRNDKNQPSFIISNREGQGLYHTDFGSDYWRGNCFSLVQQIYRCDFPTALKIIDKDFGLGISGDIPKDLTKIITWSAPKSVAKKKTIIQVKSRKFTSEELSYWNSYELSEDDIKGDYQLSTHSISELYINGRRISLKGELAFGYLFQEKYWKIYRPFSKDEKWKSNCPLNLMYGLDNIKKCKKSIIVKSAKDYYVCKKFLTNCCAGVQNESTVAISDENIEYIHSNSEECFVIFDNESVGVEACKFYNSKGFKYWNVPKRYYEKYKIKDPSDLVYHYGSSRLIKEFTKRIII